MTHAFANAPKDYRTMSTMVDCEQCNETVGTDRLKISFSSRLVSKNVYTRASSIGEARTVRSVTLPISENNNSNGSFYHQQRGMPINPFTSSGSTSGCTRKPLLEKHRRFDGVY